jgi:hypothetical protein
MLEDNQDTALTDCRVHARMTSGTLKMAMMDRVHERHAVDKEVNHDIDAR